MQSVDHPCPRRGSSPHMRGTCFQHGRRQPELRFIPAHAGNIKSLRSRSVIRSVHPRTCGEHPCQNAFLQFPDGSSPHMRGTFVRLQSILQRGRFIPAHAGNIFSRPRATIKVTVHPRTCGEHSTGIPNELPSFGSSPHMRGTSPVGGGREKMRRFIPAHAGNIRRRRRRPRRRSVHPRTCGEHVCVSEDDAHDRGSSPHMRGTWHRGVQQHVGVRFIPAHAGNIGPSAPGSRRTPVHPRTCGEHGSRTAPSSHSTGSSPHMRGTCRNSTHCVPSARFIPAHAGNITSTWAATRTTTVHPRTCGEHASADTDPADSDGSSPHMRGT